jgi:DNA-binding CsgD family transcriptional regulator
VSKLNKSLLENIGKLYDSGKRVREIAKELNVNTNYVYVALAMLEKPKQRGTRYSNCVPSEELIQKKIDSLTKILEMVRMYNTGMTFQQIADYLGVTRQYVHMALKHRNIEVA